jgi:hypothetical protein
LDASTNGDSVGYDEIGLRFLFRSGDVGADFSKTAT